MKKYIKYLLVVSLILGALFFSCKKKDFNEPKSDTIIEGKTTILVDETLLPIIEDQLAVFESVYSAKITLIPQSEKESVLSLTNSKADIIVLSRPLSKDEEVFFKNKKITPKTTPFAIDAITFIKNKKSNDTLIAIEDVIGFMKGDKIKIKGLVFDNPNSSTTRYLCELAGIQTLPKEGVFSFKSNEEVIKYISENEGMVGIVGLNWMNQPKPEMKQSIDKVVIMSVKDAKSNDYVYPSQENVANRKYPLARVLHIINCQGYAGLGMGFASFIAGEKGQRIILKSGLAPMIEPSRKIRIKN